MKTSFNPPISARSSPSHVAGAPRQQNGTAAMKTSLTPRAHVRKAGVECVGTWYQSSRQFIFTAHLLQSVCTSCKYPTLGSFQPPFRDPLSTSLCRLFYVSLFLPHSFLHELSVLISCYSVGYCNVNGSTFKMCIQYTKFVEKHRWTPFRRLNRDANVFEKSV